MRKNFSQISLFRLKLILVISKLNIFWYGGLWPFVTLRNQAFLLVQNYGPQEYGSGILSEYRYTYIIYSCN